MPTENATEAAFENAVENATEVAVEAIKPGDPEGRQPGDPNAAIELPPEEPQRAGIPVFGTEAELQAYLAEVAGAKPNVSPMPEAAPVAADPERAAAAFGERMPNTNTMQGIPVISERTRLEMEAGAEAVRRKQADINTAREAQKRHNAARLQGNDGPDAGDLSYAVPKQ